MSGIYDDGATYGAADRRERYAAAMEEAVPGCGVVTLADAAMAVADEERENDRTTLAEDLRHMQRQGKQVEALSEENARLRAERTEMSKNYLRAMEQQQVDREENARLRAKVETETDYSAALEQQIINMGGHQAAADDLRATIARVRAVLEDHSSHRDTGDLANSLYNVLEGEQP